MKTEITEILKLVKEYLVIKVEDEKEKIKSSKKWKKDLNDLFDFIVTPYGGIKGFIKTILNVYDISALKGDVDLRKGKTENQTEEDVEKIAREITQQMNSNPIPYLMSALNDDLELTVIEKYGSVKYGKIIDHPIKRIPSICQIDNNLVEKTISLFTSKNKEAIVEIFMDITKHDQFFDLFNIIYSNLSNPGLFVGARLLAMISKEIEIRKFCETIPDKLSAVINEISTNRPQ